MDINEFYERYYEFTALRSKSSFSKKVLNASEDYFHSDTYQLIKKIISQYHQPMVLDIGAGHRKLNEMIESYGVSYEYKSVDKAKNVQHDYNDINDVPQDKKFDIIFMLELIEHLTLKDSLLYITKIFQLLNKNGHLIISTPNINHINQVWKSNITHIQHYPGPDLLAILEMIGFSKGKIHRVFLKPQKRSIKSFILLKAKIILNKILGADYAHGILVIAEK